MWHILKLTIKTASWFMKGLPTVPERFMHKFRASKSFDRRVLCISSGSVSFEARSCEMAGRVLHYALLDFFSS